MYLKSWFCSTDRSEIDRKLLSWLSKQMCSCFIYWKLYNQALSHVFLLLCAVVFPVIHSSHSPFVSVLFLLKQTSNVSATLVLSRPIKGPKKVVLDLEMVTVNNVINFRGSSIIRLTIFVSEHPFWGSQMNFITTKSQAWSSCFHLQLM